MLAMENEQKKLITRRSALAGLLLIGGGIMMASSEGIKGFFGTLFNYGHLSESYHQMMRTSHDPDIRFGNFSPDGTKVVLNYRPMVDNEEGISYIGILEIATGKLQLIRPPEEYKMWYDGSFSPDGKEMVFAFTLKNKLQEDTGLCILNLVTLTFRTILKSDTGRTYLSFSPNGDRLIYFKSAYFRTKSGELKYSHSDIFEMDLSNKQEKRLTNICFRSGRAAPRYFPNGENYIFAADWPYSGFDYTEEIKQRQNIHEEKYKSNITYINNSKILQTEANPAIIYEDISYFSDISKDGKKILCIARSHLHNTTPYNYDLFLYEDGQRRQLTDLKWMIIDGAITPDGTQAVFVADTTPSRGSERKVYLYNIETNTTAPIELKPENTSWINVGQEVQS
ncbi:MAG: hypothetical protein PHW18_08220 [Sulfuricurvum sp.]|uniref:TolB family protein n=1 Tax=Sulfuricurvum sp. TaxID=2025608 RepID=UPI00260E6D8A|nr:hypothetical protein [Sulfuricurvum sp.]MDD2829542.1 hypothetical protein [Sulfuricurvum sp.]MDD4950474.1 hypothetical protein [Sulfuricurvum sp.]